MGERQGLSVLEVARMSDGNAGAPSGRIRYSSAAFLMSFLFLCGAVSAQAQSSAPTKQLEAPKPKQIVSPDAAFAESRRLSQQGKFDEAIGQLESLAAKQPDTKGLAHELGIVYYKKGDYLNAAANLKKALAADPADNEALQLMGISSYLAGHPADAIGPLEKCKPGFPAQTSMLRTFSASATSRQRIIPARASPSRKCLRFFPILPPAISSRRECSCVRILRPSLKSTQRRPSSWIPHFRWRTCC